MKNVSAMTIRPCLAITLFVALLVLGQRAAFAQEGYLFCPTGFATLGDFVAFGTVTFDTDLLTFGGVPGGVDVGGVAVFAFDSVQVPLGTTVVGRGSRPFALLSKSTVQIDGTVTADGQSSVNFTPGPFLGGSGGGRGGAGGLNPGMGPGGGLPASAICCSGSGGAGFGGLGGAGGFAIQGVGGPGGVVYGNLTLALEGGSGGAGGSTGTGGGGGGGGLFISSLAGLTVGSSGIISADGGDGAVSGFGASGGGSGGGIVLFDPVVTNNGTVRANGGHGGKGGGFGAGGGGGGGRIMVAGANAGTGTYSVVGGHTGLGGGPPQAPGSPGQNGADGVVSVDSYAFPPCKQDNTCVAPKDRVCHVPPGNSDNVHEICISNSAVPAHLDHGDYTPGLFWPDLDGDGFGAGEASDGCVVPDGFANNVDDCNDSDASVNPDAVEIPGDGIDNDCDPSTPDTLGLCGNGKLDPGEEADPPPGASTSVPLNPQACRYDFSGINQWYCNGACGNWELGPGVSGNGCGQGDADAFCKLLTDNPASTATSFGTTTASDAPGVCCPPPTSPPGTLGCVDLGVLSSRGVAVNVSVHDTSVLSTHGGGTVINNLVCTDP